MSAGKPHPVPSSATPRHGTLTLVLGGVRSGKSHFAQSLAQELGGERVLFIATAEPGDAEMQRRIALHRQSRPETWRTLETPFISTLTAEVIQQQLPFAAGEEPGVVLVDCLTLLVSNCICRPDADCDGPDAVTRLEADVNREVQSLCDLAARHHIHLVIVSGEVGLGLVSESRLGRIFKDLLGIANQRLASCANASYFMLAGHPVPLHALSSNVLDVAQQLESTIEKVCHAQ